MSQVPGAERRNTLLHEIAHALCPKGEHHGVEWKATARRIGANPKSHVDTSDMGVEKDLPVVGTCPVGHEFRRTTMPPANRKYHCTHSSHRGQPVAVRHLTWSRRRTAPMDPQLVAAIRKYSPRPTAKVEMTFAVVDRVTIYSTGSAKWDGKTGTIKSIAKVNYILGDIEGELRGLRIKGKYLR